MCRIALPKNPDERTRTSSMYEATTTWIEMRFLRIPRFAWVLFLVLVVSAAVQPLFNLGGSTGDFRPFIVEFRETSFDYGIGNGRIGFGHVNTHAVNQWRPNVTGLEYSIDWTDESATPLSDPQVDIKLTAPSGISRELTNVPSQGQSIVIRIGTAPPNVTVMAGSSYDAIQIANASANFSQEAIGEWLITITVGTPSSRNPVLSGEITYNERFVLYEFNAFAVEDPSPE